MQQCGSAASFWRYPKHKNTKTVLPTLRGKKGYKKFRWIVLWLTDRYNYKEKKEKEKNVLRFLIPGELKQTENNFDLEILKSQKLHSTWLNSGAIFQRFKRRRRNLQLRRQDRNIGWKEDQRLRVSYTVSIQL